MDKPANKQTKRDSHPYLAQSASERLIKSQCICLLSDLWPSFACGVQAGSPSAGSPSPPKSVCSSSSTSTDQHHHHQLAHVLNATSKVSSPGGESLDIFVFVARVSLFLCLSGFAGVCSKCDCTGKVFVNH